MIRQSISSEVEASREMEVLPKRMEIEFVIPESCDSRESGNTPGAGGVMGTMS